MMFVWNKFMTQTGTIIYETSQDLVSGLISYTGDPFNLETGCRFTIVKRINYVRRNDETSRGVYDILTVQFGWDQLRALSETGIQVKVGRTRLQYDGDEFRATNVNNFGQKYNKNYMPLGVVQATFEKRVPLAY